MAFPGLTTDDSEDDSQTLAGRRSLDEAADAKINEQKQNDGSSGGGGKSSIDGFGQSLLAAGIGGNLVSSLSKPRLDTFNSKRNVMGSSSSSSKLEILQMLEEWEEPDMRTNLKASIKDILQFRQASALVGDVYFSFF